MSVCPECSQVVAYMNTLSGKRFRPKSANLVNLHARHKEYSVEDCLRVARVKAHKWVGTTMEDYYRPSTLFRASHFDEYLNERLPGEKPAPAPKVEVEFGFTCTKCMSVWSRKAPDVPGWVGAIKVGRVSADAMTKGRVGVGLACSCNEPVQVNKR